MSSIHSDWWPMLVAIVFAMCLASRGFYAMNTDRTIEGAPPGYVRTDYHGSTVASAGAVIVFAMAWVVPWVVTELVEVLSFLQEDMVGVFGIASGSLSVFLAMAGIHVKYIAKDSSEVFYSGEGERTARSVRYTVVAAMFGCVAASLFAISG